MGLAGRKQKQVIQADPRNTAWINDKNNIGAKLLSSMGYVEPGSAEASGASDSEPKIGLAGWVPNKRLRAIPAAKSGMEGIGYRAAGPNAASDVGALPMSLGGLASASSTVFSRLGSKAALRFVSAGASNEVISRAKTEGGEFSGLLQRLNAASAAASEAPTPRETTPDAGTLPSNQGSTHASTSALEAIETKEQRRERKRLRKLEKETRRAAKEAKRAGKAAEVIKAQAPITSGDESSEEAKPVQSVTPFNPRMAYVDAVVRIRHSLLTGSTDLALATSHQSVCCTLPKPLWPKSWASRRRRPSLVIRCGLDLLTSAHRVSLRRSLRLLHLQYPKILQQNRRRSANERSTRNVSFPFYLSPSSDPLLCLQVEAVRVIRHCCWPIGKDTPNTDLLCQDVKDSHHVSIFLHCRRNVLIVITAAADLKPAGTLETPRDQRHVVCFCCQRVLAWHDCACAIVELRQSEHGGRHNLHATTSKCWQAGSRVCVPCRCIDTLVEVDGLGTKLRLLIDPVEDIIWQERLCEYTACRDIPTLVHVDHILGILLLRIVVERHGNFRRLQLRSEAQAPGIDNVGMLLQC